MNTKLTRLWLLTTAILGVATMVLTYVYAATEATWFDEHGLPDDIDAIPLFILFFIGIVITFGSIFTFLDLRKTVDPTAKP
jgi:formate hydrogenlyase subunit 3/multisubunit Na+/H+ antiporter MnhD subunit